MNRAVGQTHHLLYTFILCTFCQEEWGSKPEDNFQIKVLVIVNFLGIKRSGRPSRVPFSKQEVKW